MWVDPDGTLIDITPDVVGGEASLFVPVANYPEPFDFDRMPPTRYRVLYTGADRSAAVAERIARMKPAQLAYEDRRARKAGKTLEKWILDKSYHDPLPDQIAAFIAACDAFDARLPLLPDLIVTDPDAETEEYLDPSPDAQGEAEFVVAAPDAASAFAVDHGGDAREEAVPVEPDSTIELETGPLADIPAGSRPEIIDVEPDDDDMFDDLDEPFDVTWYAAESLDEWSWKRDTCREAILRAMEDE